MELVYIMAQGHTGSTLMDCILGTHPEFISSGELKYLNWQLERIKQSNGKLDEAVCSCLKNFQKCEYWSQVFNQIEVKTGENIVKVPADFDIAYFGRFSYKQRGGFKVSFANKVKEKLVYVSLLAGTSFTKLLKIDPKIEKWVQNNWLLYETMSEVGKKSVVIDSSKDLIRALLLHKFKPTKTTIIFVHRSAHGLTSSIKRKVIKQKRATWIALPYVIFAKISYNIKIKIVKRRFRTLSFVDVDYENYVGHPTNFVDQIASKLQLNTKYPKQPNDDFYIDPSSLHLVAGNPMRYRGKQRVTYDSRWKKDLNKFEAFLLNLLFGKMSN